MRMLRIILSAAIAAGILISAFLWTVQAADDPSLDVPYTFKYWTASEKRGQFMQQMAQAWNRLHPKQALHIEASVFDADRIDAITWTSLHSGILLPGLEAPDLVDVDFQYFPKYSNQRYCLLNPLNEIVSHYILEQGDNGIFDAYTYRDMCFGIPFGADEIILVYRHQLLYDAGIDMESILTWDAFTWAGKQLAAVSDTRMIGIDMDQYLLFYTVLQQLCARNEGRTPDDATYREALNMISELYREGIAILMPGGRINSKSFINAFLSGDIACVLMRRSDYLELLPAFADITDDLRITELPGFGLSRQVRVPGHATAITIACTQVRLLSDFMTFARLDTQAQSEMMQWFGYTLSDPIFQQESGCFDNTDKVLEYLETYELDLAKLIFSP